MGAPVPEDDADRVPDEVIAHAKEAFARRSTGQVASLVFDTLVDEGAPAEDHQLRFEHPLARVELHVSAGETDSRLHGSLERSEARRVELEFDMGNVSRVAEVSDMRFEFEPVPHGLIRLTLLDESGAPMLHTDWFRV
jgi:hypothetical protein